MIFFFWCLELAGLGISVAILSAGLFDYFYNPFADRPWRREPIISVWRVGFYFGSNDHWHVGIVTTEGEVWDRVLWRLYWHVCTVSED